MATKRKKMADKRLIPVPEQKRGLVSDLIFWILAAIAVIAAFAVVGLRNVFRAALALILLFLVIAGIYITLSADFLALVQILVYVGAISILLLVALC